MVNKSGIRLETDERGSRMYLVDKKGNETLASEVKVDKDEQLLSCVKLDVDNLNIVRPDSDGREILLDTDFIESSDLKISDDFVKRVDSKSSFIESLRAVNFNFDNIAVANLMNEVSNLRVEVSELKQKLEEE